MTHLPEQPNPAQPWLDRARQFAAGGIMGVLGNEGIVPQSWNEWPSYFAHGLGEAGQFNPLLGTLKLVKPTILDPHPWGWGGDEYSVIHAETGQERARTWLSFDPRTKNLHLNFGETRGKGAYGDERKWGLGKHPLDAAL